MFKYRVHLTRSNKQECKREAEIDFQNWPNMYECDILLNSRIIVGRENSGGEKRPNRQVFGKGCPNPRQGNICI